MTDVDERMETRLMSACESLPSSGRIFLKLFLHSVAMFTLPFWAYFFFRDYAERDFKAEPPWTYISGAVAAICVIQVIIFSYLYQAFKEERIERKLKESAKRD